MFGGLYLRQGREGEERLQLQGLEILCLPLSRRGAGSVRRVEKAARRLGKSGCRQLLLGDGIRWEASAGQAPARLTALPLRRAMAVETGLHLLREQGLEPGRCTVALVAGEATPALFRQAEELSRHLRYLVLGLDRGGAELCALLQRRLGLPVRLLEPGQRALAELTLLYEKRPGWENRGAVCLPLYPAAEAPWPVRYQAQEQESPLFRRFPGELLLSALAEKGILQKKTVKICTKMRNA